jgi:hypothetical protein
VDFDVAGDHQNPEAADSRKMASRGLRANVMRGLTAAGIVISGALPGPTVPATDMAWDWEAIGSDIRNATRKYAARSG